MKKVIVLIFVAIIFAVQFGCQNSNEDSQQNPELLYVLEFNNNTLGAINEQNGIYAQDLQKLLDEEPIYDSVLISSLYVMAHAHIETSTEFIDAIDNRRTLKGKLIVDELTISCSREAIESITCALVYILAMNVNVSGEENICSTIMDKPLRKIKEGEPYENYVVYLEGFASENASYFQKHGL